MNIGLAVISLLKRVHSAGYVYNDLKLENIMCGYADSVEKTDFNLSGKSINLVDFGFASKYLDKRGNHIE